MGEIKDDLLDAALIAGGAYAGRKAGRAFRYATATKGERSAIDAVKRDKGKVYTQRYPKGVLSKNTPAGRDLINGRAATKVGTGGGAVGGLAAAMARQRNQ